MDYCRCCQARCQALCPRLLWIMNVLLSTCYILADKKLASTLSSHWVSNHRQQCIKRLLQLHADWLRSTWLLPNMHNVQGHTEVLYHIHTHAAVDQDGGVPVQSHSDQPLILYALSEFHHFGNVKESLWWWIRPDQLEVEVSKLTPVYSTPVCGT